MKPNLQELVARWQDLLRLRDWRLKVDYVPNLAANGGPVHGLCVPFVDAKRATIRIRDPETPATPNDPPVEDTLVHELLHLHLAPLANHSGPGIAAEEQAVWAITEAIASIKDSGARARLARAFVGAAQRTPRMRRERKRLMDPIILAALKAALTSEDPKAAIEALIAQLEGGGGEGGAGGSSDTAATQGTGDNANTTDDDQPRAAAAPPAGQQPRAARTAPTGQPTQAPAAAQPQPATRAVVPASSLVSRREFDRFRVERLLDRRPDLSEAQRSFALEQPYDVVDRWLKVTPAPGASEDASTTAPAARTQRAALPNTPTHAQRARSAPDPVLAEVDRRMGIPQAPEQSVQRDPVTGRLTISSLQPVRVKGGA